MKNIILILYVCIITSYVYADSVDRFENKFGLVVFSEYNTSFFDKQWNKSNPKGAQIHKTDLIEITNLLDSIFSIYPHEIISKNIESIYLLNNLVINKENQSVVKWSNSLYIAVNDEGGRFSQKKLVNEIKKNISNLLYDKFKLYINKNKWKLYYNKNSKNINNKQLLYEQGFVKNSTVTSIYNDIVDYIDLYFTDKNKLDSLSEKYELILKKNKIIVEFIDLISENSFYNKKIENRIDSINNMYNVNIKYGYSIYNFPSNWFKKSYNVTGGQMSINSIDSTLNIIEKFLNRNRNYFIDKLVYNIYLVDNLKLSNVETTTKVNYNSIFVSNNSSSKKIYKDLEFHFIYMFYLNFNSYFPVNKWQAISEKDSLYLSDWGSQNLFYDYYDYFLLHKNNTDSLVNKKSIVFRNYYNKCDSIVNIINNINLKDEIDKIGEENNINVFFFSKKVLLPNNIVKPVSLLLLGRINEIQLYRYINVLNDFFNIVPKQIINKNLKNIYLYGGFRYFNSSDIAGTYELNSSSLFLVSNGNSDDFLIGTIVHEFSSLLLYKIPFNSDTWLTLNDKDFKYQNISSKKDPYSHSKELYENGFIDLYSTTCFENDFNEFSKWYFLKTEKLITLSQKYTQTK